MFCSTYAVHFPLDPRHYFELVSGIEKAPQGKTKEGKVNEKAESSGLYETYFLISTIFGEKKFSNFRVFMIAKLVKIKESMMQVIMCKANMAIS